MKKMKKRTALLGSKKHKLQKLRVGNRFKREALKKGNVSNKTRILGLLGLRTKKVRKTKIKPQKRDDEPLIEHFPSEGFVNLCSQVSARPDEAFRFLD